MATGLPSRRGWRSTGTSTHGLLMAQSCQEVFISDASNPPFRCFIGAIHAANARAAFLSLISLASLSIHFYSAILLRNGCIHVKEKWPSCLIASFSVSVSWAFILSICQSRICSGPSAFSAWIIRAVLSENGPISLLDRWRNSIEVLPIHIYGSALMIHRQAAREPGYQVRGCSEQHYRMARYPIRFPL